MKTITKPLVAALLVVAVLFGFAGAATAQDPDAPSIGEVVAGDTDFATLGAALALTGLGDMFTDCAGGPYTVLAPNEDAFAATLGALGIELADLVADPDLVATILTYHVIEGAVTSDVVAGLDGASAPTVQGEDVSVAVDGDTISLLSGNPSPVNVIAADVAACNGVIHVIDGVLLPPTVGESLGLEGSAAQGDAPAEEAEEAEESAEEEPAEELANTGANSAMVAIFAVALLAGGLMTVAAVRPARRRS